MQCRVDSIKFVITDPLLPLLVLVIFSKISKRFSSCAQEVHIQKCLNLDEITLVEGKGLGVAPKC